MLQADMQQVDIVIIGTGFGGIGMAIQLKKAGYHDFLILEKAADIGGTWRDNTYPGAACDVQSHLYSFSFEPNSHWSRKFGGQAEIHAYMTRCVAQYGLQSHIRFNQQVDLAQFDDVSGRWTLTTATGEQFNARSVIAATGQLNQPAWPAIEGLDSFQGELFHSARWHHEYSLSGKRVAVIGTGASAIQFVPEIVKSVEQLYLFQRSGAWVIDKPDRPFNALEKAVFQHSAMADRLYRDLIYAKNEVRALAFTRFNWLLKPFAWRAHWLAKKHIRDAEKRRRILPDYQIGCKRILLSNDWYQAIDRDNLDLITTTVERIDAEALITADGQRYPVDAIIFGTGFKTTDFLPQINVVGRRGAVLKDCWQEGAEAYKGTAVSGFPNFFLLYGPNTNLAHNSILFMLESQYRYVLNHLAVLAKEKLRYLDVKAEAQRDFNHKLQQQLQSSVWTQCQSWYVNKGGKITNNWSGFTFIFRLLAANFNLKDYEMSLDEASLN